MWLWHRNEPSHTHSHPLSHTHTHAHKHTLTHTHTRAHMHTLSCHQRWLCFEFCCHCVVTYNVGYTMPDEWGLDNSRWGEQDQCYCLIKNMPQVGHGMERKCLIGWRPYFGVQIRRLWSALFKVGQVIETKICLCFFEPYQNVPPPSVRAVRAKGQTQTGYAPFPRYCMVPHSLAISIVSHTFQIMMIAIFFLLLKSFYFQDLSNTDVQHSTTVWLVLCCSNQCQPHLCHCEYDLVIELRLPNLSPLLYYE